MKTTFLIVSAAISAFILLFIVLAVMSRSGKAPGLTEGRLAKCPDTPNCVCSEQKDDTRHFIAPIMIPSAVTIDSLALLKTTIREMGGTLRAESDNYLASTFSSPLFGFVR
ncbi:MAG: hypothetical protein BM485_01720 [Desulfobulbaceae bacterium DB1]|nr:MAG: hypothetical protein BM485_01720 [Desulfobulbaceae bacterium DB1]